MLRIHRRRLARRNPEKARVEQIHIRQRAFCFYIIGLLQEFRIYAGLQQLFVAEKRNRLNPVANIAPEFVNVVGAGETSRHADDGNCVEGVVRIHIRNRNSCRLHDATGLV